MEETELLYARATILQLVGSYTVKGTKDQQNDLERLLTVFNYLIEDRNNFKQFYIDFKGQLEPKALNLLDEYSDKIRILEKEVDQLKQNIK